jgi:hypothetical protein
MDLRDLLIAFLVWVVYPLWLIAGFLDYLLHRKTRIERTSGPKESWLHVAQFASLGIPLILLTFLMVTPLVITIVSGTLVTHTALSIADVSYTEGRRYISPLEQHAHAFMNVLPLVATGIAVMLSWNELMNAGWVIESKSDPIPRLSAGLLVGSYFVFAGTPILEELIRTSRGFRHHQVKDSHERDESYDT